MDRFPLETWFFEVPPITRYYTLTALFLSLLVQCDLVTPFQLFFSWHTAVQKAQYWRFLTTFLFFGHLSVDFLFHLFFMSRYARMLEESYARRTVEFAWMMGVMGAGLLLLSPLTTDPFLASPLSFTLTYLWSRRQASVEMSFLGLFTFSAAWLPVVLISFSVVVNSRVPTADLIGGVVGHAYYFLEDVWPEHEASGGRHWLACPDFLKRLVGQVVDDPPDPHPAAAANPPHGHAEPHAHDE